MYKIIIADDEVNLRVSLSQALPWQELGFELSGVYADGQDVLDSLEYIEPDVILTDIVMTCLSGIEIARYVYENKYPCRIVFISAHQEFSLAQQGIRYGVTDYLSKPVSMEELKQTMIRVRQSLDQDAEIQKKLREKTWYSHLLPEMKEQFFSDVVLGILQNREYIRSRMEIMYPGREPDKCSCALIDLRFPGFQEFLKNVWDGGQAEFNDAVRGFFSQSDAEADVNIAYQTGEYWKLCAVFSEAARGKEEAVLGLIFSSLSNKFGMKTRMTSVRLYENLSAAAQACREQMFSERQMSPEQNRHLQEQKKLILSNVENGNLFAAQRLFRLVMEELREYDVVFCQNAAIEVFSLMIEAFRQNGAQIPDGDKVGVNYSVIAKQRDNAQLAEICDRIFDKLRQTAGERGLSDSGGIVVKAQKYIQEHVSEDLSQESVAAALYISTSYLSRTFKQKTGETFTAYATRVKMNRAIEMLRNPRYKTYQIGEALGYGTPRYFTHLFKQQTGMTPYEYRCQILSIGGETEEHDGR